jgi:tetratricopeptide (TPR) repeat protein
MLNIERYKSDLFSSDINKKWSIIIHIENLVSISYRGKKVTYLKDMFFLTNRSFSRNILWISEERKMVGDKDRIFELAQKITQKKGLKKSIKEYQQVLDKNPSDIKTRIKLGDLYLRRGNLDKAVKEYFKVGERYINEDLDLKAIAMFKRILVLSPMMVESYYKLADLYYKRGLFGEARLQYQKVLEIDSKDKKAQDGLRMIESRVAKANTSEQNVVDDAVREKDPVWNAILQELQRQLSAQLREDDYQTHYHLGIAFKEMDLMQKAIEEFKIALADPNLEFSGYLMLGMCYREMGVYNEAIEFLKKGLRIKPLTTQQYEDIFYQLGLTYEAEGQVKDALAAFNKVTELRGGKGSADVQSKVQRLKDQLQSS